MKKTAILLALLMPIIALAYTVTVTTSSTVLVPKAQPQPWETTTWAVSNVVAQGDYCVNTNATPYVYFATTAGTSTNMPTNTVYAAVSTNDAVTWVCIGKQGELYPRKNAVIFADQSTTVYYTLDGRDATTGDSILDALNPARGTDTQGEAKGIVSSGTASVNVELE